MYFLTTKAYQEQTFEEQYVTPKGMTYDSVMWLFLSAQHLKLHFKQSWWPGANACNSDLLSQLDKEINTNVIISKGDMTCCGKKYKQYLEVKFYLSENKKHPHLNIIKYSSIKENIFDWWKELTTSLPCPLMQDLLVH